MEFQGCRQMRRTNPGRFPELGDRREGGTGRTTRLHRVSRATQTNTGELGWLTATAVVPVPVPAAIAALCRQVAGQCVAAAESMGA